MLTFLSLLEAVTPFKLNIADFLSSGDIVSIILIIVWFALHFALYNKDKWDGLIDKYKGEHIKQKKRGTAIVLAYLIGSILLFFICLPILF